MKFLIGAYKSKQQCALDLIRLLGKSSSQADLVTQHESIFDSQNSQWALKAQTYESEISTFHNIIGDLKKSSTDFTLALNLEIQTIQSENLHLQEKLSTITEDSESKLASQTQELDILRTKVHSLEEYESFMMSEHNRMTSTFTAQIRSNELQIGAYALSFTQNTSS